MRRDAAKPHNPVTAIIGRRYYGSATTDQHKGLIAICLIEIVELTLCRSRVSGSSGL
jgi:hypothetical protein